MLARNRPRTHCVPNFAREIGAGVYKPTALVNPEVNAQPVVPHFEISRA
jgi:hypothetical protein